MGQLPLITAYSTCFKSVDEIAHTDFSEFLSFYPEVSPRPLALPLTIQLFITTILLYTVYKHPTTIILNILKHNLPLTSLHYFPKVHPPSLNDALV